VNNPAHHPVHRVSQTQSGDVFSNGQVQSQTQKYVPPHHGHNSDGSLSIHTYNATEQSEQSHSHRFHYAPNQPVAPPVHQLPPGPSGYTTGYTTYLPADNASASASAQGQIRETAPIKRTTLSKKKNSSANVGLQGWEKWRWDVADEVYAAMNSAEKKQIRNRYGARTFRAKKKGMSSPPLSVPQRLTISGGYVKSGRCRTPKTPSNDPRTTGNDAPSSTQCSPRTTEWTTRKFYALISPIRRAQSIIRLFGIRPRFPRSRIRTRVNSVF
jgi:hypothetical protein